MPIGLPIALLLGTLFGGLLWVLPVSKMVILLAGFAITLTRVSASGAWNCSSTIPLTKHRPGNCQ